MKSISVFIYRVFKRLPFTFFMLALLAWTAWITETDAGKLSIHWVNRLGYAPNDLLLFDGWRLITSALITDGARTFWLALLMILLAVGSAEWLTGTPHTFLTFWGIHLITLLIQTLLIAWPMHMMGLKIGTALLLARDVGPSAGYFACVGLTLNSISKPWNRLTGSIVLAWLFVNFILSLTNQPIVIVKMSADMAHLIAFPLGWLSGLIGDSRKRQGKPLIISPG
jgi:hypothetical protein